MNRDEFDRIYNSEIGILLNEDFEEFIADEIDTAGEAYHKQYNPANTLFGLSTAEHRDLMSALMRMGV